MKQFEVVKDFKGSPDGCTVRQFKAGEVVEESEFGEQDLCQVAYKQKWIKPVKVVQKTEDPGAKDQG